MNGNGKVEGLLERIAEGQDRLREELADHKEATTKAIGELAAGQERLRQDMNRGQDQLRQDMNRGFAQVNTRIDNVLAIAGRHHDDHEQRIQVLEERVLGKSG